MSSANDVIKHRHFKLKVYKVKLIFLIIKLNRPLKNITKVFFNGKIFKLSYLFILYILVTNCKHYFYCLV